MLDRGADPNSRDEDDDPIISKAVELDLPEIVKIIIDAKGDLEWPASRDHDTPLLQSVARGKLSCLKLLLKVGNVAATTHHGHGILVTAVCTGDVETLKIVLDCPEVNAQECDTRGESALWWAVRCSKRDVITTMLENPRIKDSIRNGIDRNILHGARVLYNLRLDTLNSLLGCEVVIQNCCRLINGWSPLHCAVRKKWVSG